MVTLSNIRPAKWVPTLAIIALALGTISPAQALDIKQEQIDSCVTAAATYKMADPATATKFCSCTVNVRAKMTLEQMWEIESYARSGKDPSTLPYAQRMQKQLQQCTDGLTLNPPQQPS